MADLINLQSTIYISVARYFDLRFFRTNTQLLSEPLFTINFCNIVIFLSLDYFGPTEAIAEGLVASSFSRNSLDYVEFVEKNTGHLKRIEDGDIHLLSSGTNYLQTDTWPGSKNEDFYHLDDDGNLLPPDNERISGCSIFALQATSAICINPSGIFLLPRVQG